METLEDTFEQFKQLPDWDRFPLPECIYHKFNIKKPKPSVGLMESLAYQPPPHQSLNKNGKVEIRKPAEGGVREIKEFLTLPTEVKMITDEEVDEANEPKDQNADDKKQDSDPKMLNLPTEDTKKDTQPE